jgi:AcrR family transcriptional regulator
MQHSRGRPRSFDRDQALRQAMQVFWEKGYEGTTMADLTAAMGIKAPSLYSAFGDKNALFREAVDLYSRTTAAAPMDALQAGRSLRDDISNMLHASIAMFAEGANSRGCMVVTSAINCAPENRAHAEELTVRRLKKRQALTMRLQRAQEEHELSADADITGLADFYTAVLHGLSLSARDGISCERLSNTICHAMRALDSVLLLPKTSVAKQ